MQFRVSSTVQRGDLRKHELSQMTALRGTRAREDLFLSYSEKYMFWKVESTHVLEESRIKTKRSKNIADLNGRCHDVRYTRRLM